MSAPDVSALRSLLGRDLTASESTVAVAAFQQAVKDTAVVHEQGFNQGFLVGVNAGLEEAINAIKKVEL